MWLNRKRKNCKYQGAGFKVKGIADKTLTPHPYTLNPNRGFTLIEVLIATSILGIIGLTILTTFASGLNVYERVQLFGGVQSNALLALEEMEKKLRNVFPSSAISFEGDTQSIAFPAVIEVMKTVDGQEMAVSSIGKISYYLDYEGGHSNSQAKVLMQAQQDYSQAVTGQEIKAEQSNALVFIEDIAFSYYAYDEDENEFSWQDSWDAEEEKILTGVKVEMDYKDGDQDVELVRTVLIPAAHKIEEDEAGEEEDDDEDDEEEGEGEGEGSYPSSQ